MLATGLNHCLDGSWYEPCGILSALPQILYLLTWGEHRSTGQELDLLTHTHKHFRHDCDRYTSAMQGFQVRAILDWESVTSERLCLILPGCFISWAREKPLVTGWDRALLYQAFPRTSEFKYRGLYGSSIFSLLKWAQELIFHAELFSSKMSLHNPGFGFFFFSFFSLFVCNWRL